MSYLFQKTPDQQQAIRLLGGRANNILLYGGSRSGKTFITLYALIYRALSVPKSRHAVLRFRANAIRQSVVNDTLPSVCRLCFPRLKYQLNKQDMFILFENGSEIWFCGLDTPERSEKILGREFATIYFNECSEIDYTSVLLAQTRLAQRTKLRNRAFFDCNPPGTSHWTYQLFVRKKDPISGEKLTHPELYNCMLMNPTGNKTNLPPRYIEETLANLSFRQRERFLEGRFADDIEGALWQREWIENARETIELEELEEIVVGVDPAVTSSKNSDSTGIVVCGRSPNRHIYVLADYSIRGTPLQWTQKVCAAYEHFSADRVVGESNNGGDLIELALRNVDNHLNFRKVVATRGKFLRAEPVAALYEQGLVHHLAHFKHLEQQLCTYVPHQYDGSPDRLDALVWAITELTRHQHQRNRFIPA